MSVHSALAGRSLGALADELARGECGLGGGVVAALTASHAAALVVLVARASADVWPEAGGCAGQAAALHARAVELAEEDADAYGAAYGALHPGEGARERDGALGAALERAADVPLRVATLATDVAELAAEAARHGVADRRVDAAVAAVLAEATARAAVMLVDVNLGVVGDDARLAAGRHHLAAAVAARDGACAALPA